MTLKASICIPSYNRRQTLLATLRSLDGQTVEPDRYEAIVADDGSTDGTGEALSRLQTRYRLRWLRQENAGPAAARNAAARMAEHEVLIFLDGDQLCRPEMVAAHLDIHEREGNVLVQGLYPLADGCRSRGASLLYERALLGALAPVDRPHPVSPHVWGGQISVRRSVWEQVGGFDSSFRGYGGEDTDFGLRVAALGVPFVFDPRALSHHLHEVRYGSFARQAYEEGRSVIRLSRKHLIPVETLFGGPVGRPADLVFQVAWSRSELAMGRLGRLLTVAMMAADAVRLRSAQLLSARFVHRFYKLGGLVAEALRPEGRRVLERTRWNSAQ